LREADLEESRQEGRVTDRVLSGARGVGSSSGTSKLRERRKLGKAVARVDSVNQDLTGNGITGNVVRKGKKKRNPGA